MRQYYRPQMSIQVGDDDTELTRADIEDFEHEGN